MATKRETAERVLARLRQIKDEGDWEAGHVEADRLLCELLTVILANGMPETQKKPRSA
ncbi:MULTISPECIES: hypothetical protein [unclassified Mesorhizobium]|uniref:hypothetical protein n=1 Tax=unclassified Mesorhizobium TaxID=325217 RepID=UPI001675C1EC|nr:MULTISPECIES: hypothetical protein [unclassified Mesorhizobium]